MPEIQRSGWRPRPEQRHVAAPRPAGEDRARRVGDAASHEVVEAREHVLELDEADVPGELVAPRLAEADRPAVVDHRDEEAGVDVRLDVGRPAVHVEEVRPAVHPHDHGVRAVAVGADQEPVDPLAVGVLEPPRLERPAIGRAGALGLEQGRRRPDREQPRRVLAVVDAVPDLAVGPDRGRGDRARLGVERLVSGRWPARTGAGGDGPRRAGAAAAPTVGPPVDGLDRAREVQLEVDEVAGPRVPEAGRSSPVRSCVIAIRVSPAIGENAHPASCRPASHSSRDVAAGRRVDRAQRRVEHVAVLHDLEHDDRLVRARARSGRRRRSGPSRRRGGRAARARGPCARRAPPSAAQTEKPASAADARDGPPPADREPLGPALAACPRAAAPARLSSNGAMTQVPVSAPVASWNQMTPVPSRVGRPSRMPTGSNVTWRRTPVRRSHACSW